jgi:hypothetical protein
MKEIIGGGEISNGMLILEEKLNQIGMNQLRINDDIKTQKLISFLNFNQEFPHF